MTTFADKVTERLAPRLLAEHGETVTYTPYGLTARSLTAVVTRRTLNTQPSGPQAHLAYEVELTVSQADLTGVNVGGDRVTLTTRLGGATKTYAVAALLGCDGGLWRLALR